MFQLRAGPANFAWSLSVGVTSVFSAVLTQVLGVWFGVAKPKTADP